MLEARALPRAPADQLARLLAAEHGLRFRSAPLPAVPAARAAGRAPRPSTSPARWARRSAGCCACRRRSTWATCTIPRVTVAERARAPARAAAPRRVLPSTRRSRGADRVTVAVTLFALLELYKQGEAPGSRTSRSARSPSPAASAAPAPRGGGARERAGSRASRRCCSSRPSPVARDRARRRRAGARTRSSRRSARAARATRPGGRGIVLRELAGGWTLAIAPDTEEAARRLLAQPRTPPLTPAQAETLAIVAYLQPVSRPEIARIRGVSADRRRHAARARPDRGGRPLAVRRRPLPHDAAVPQALRPELARRPARRPRQWDPTPRARRPSCATACSRPARRGRGGAAARHRLSDGAAPAQRSARRAACAASCPQAASMSRPRVRRTVARRPCSSSAAWNAAIASRPEPS